MVRENLEGVGDEETGETDGVEDTEDPDEDDLGDTEGLGLALVLKLGGHDGPEGEGDDHAGDGDEEEWATADLVNEGGGVDGDDQRKKGVADLELERASQRCAGDGRGYGLVLTPSWGFWPAIPAVW